MRGFLTRLSLVLSTTSALVTAFASPTSIAVSTSSTITQHYVGLSGRSPRIRHPNAQKSLISPSLSAVTTFPRGGALNSLSSVSSALSGWKSTPTSLFNTSLVVLAMATATAKLLQKRIATSESGGSDSKTATPPAIQSLQRRFLAVFWLLRCADWLQGPYFYEVYASKVFGGVQASLGLVSRLFLTGFASTALFGPAVGRAADQYGRKRGTLAFSIIYALGAFSTKSPLLTVLFVGRVLSGIGTSLLFSAPESWLVGEAQKLKKDDPDGRYVGETFGLAYAGDSIVAILAGQIAAIAASNRGPTGPFEVSTAFLLFGGLMASFLWQENTASRDSSSASSKPSITEAIKVIKDDPKIMMVGAVQSLFEAAMYIFVLQWPPAMSSSIQKMFGATGTGTPYGTIFSCFMASCLFGATVFGQLVKMSVPTETFTAAMLAVAALAMSSATWLVSAGGNSLWGLMASFFIFEMCVGMYFPGIGTLRSKYVPDSHRSVIMNLFGIPLNALVVTVFLTLDKLGLKGALSISSGALGVAALCMLKLRQLVGKSMKPSTAG